jgi:uncharacterized protein (TIGR02466 family)
MIVQQYFPAVVLTELLTSINVNQLQDYAYELKSNNSGRTVTNYGGWQSENLDYNNEIIKPLVQQIYNHVAVLHEIHHIKTKYIPIIDNIWININAKGGFNRPHLHNDDLFSGVFYLKTPEKCGDIVFSHPALQQQYHYRSDHPIVEQWTETNSGIMFQHAQVGKLILFPSWLVHYVEPNLSDDDRISIAFNTKLIERNE